MSKRLHKSAGRRTRLGGVMVAGWLLCSDIAAQQTSIPVHADRSVELHIARQPLIDALRAFAEQTGLEVAFRTEEIDPTLISRAVVGNYTPEAALAQLLANSRLHAFRVTERLIAVKPPERGSTGHDPEKPPP